MAKRGRKAKPGRKAARVKIKGNPGAVIRRALFSGGSPSRAEPPASKPK